MWQATAFRAYVAPMHHHVRSVHTWQALASLKLLIAEHELEAGRAGEVVDLEAELPNMKDDDVAMS